MREALDGSCDTGLAHLASLHGVGFVRRVVDRAIGVDMKLCQKVVICLLARTLLTD